MWFVDSNDTSQAAFFYDGATGALQKFPFSDQSDYLVYGQDVGMAVAPTGHVWVGIDSTLIGIDPTTGAVQRMAVPTVTPDSTASALAGTIGAEIAATTDITNVAVDGAGNVNLAFTNSSELMRYNPTSGAFSPLQLASGVRPSTLAANSSGALVATAGAGNQTVVVGPASSTPASVDAGGFDLGCAHGLCATTSGPSQVTVLTPTTQAGSPSVKPAL